MSDTDDSQPDGRIQDKRIPDKRTETPSRKPIEDDTMRTATAYTPPGHGSEHEADRSSRDSEPNGPRLAFSEVRHRRALRDASDRELLDALSRADESALDELIERKTAPLLQVAQRILGDAEEARDVVQVTFLRLWENRASYDGKWSPNTWIYRITTNLAIDHLRARKSRERIAEPVRLHLRDMAEYRASRDLAALHEDEVMTIFQELAAELTERQRVVFLLREVEGLPSKEVADIVGCRESTVRNHLFNARRELRRRLIERYPEYARLADGSEEEGS